MSSLQPSGSSRFPLGRADTTPSYACAMTPLGSLRVPILALVGAMVGVLYVWLTRNQAPEGKTLANGMQVIQPVYVSPTAWWMYVAFALIGAVVALLAATTVARLRRT
jgi:hypothetical protein